MPHTLVTGANSFLAAHIINELISTGHTVTGAVRRASAGEDVLKEHPEWKEKLDFVVVEDYTKQESFDAVFREQQFDHIVHVAAPMPGRPSVTEYDRDFLRPSVDGNLALLSSAKAHAPGLKSIVVTGSINSVTPGFPEDNRKREYTNDGWNDFTPEIARKSDNMLVLYCSSKKEGELAIWDFVKTEKPHFTVRLSSLIRRHDELTSCAGHCSTDGTYFWSADTAYD